MQNEEMQRALYAMGEELKRTFDRMADSLAQIAEALETISEDTGDMARAGTDRVREWADSAEDDEEPGR